MLLKPVLCVGGKNWLCAMVSSLWVQNLSIFCFSSFSHSWIFDERYSWTDSGSFTLWKKIQLQEIYQKISRGGFQVQHNPNNWLSITFCSPVHYFGHPLWSSCYLNVSGEHQLCLSNFKSNSYTEKSICSVSRMENIALTCACKENLFLPTYAKFSTRFCE